MQNVSREQIEERIRQILDDEQISLADLSFDHFMKDSLPPEIDLKSLFNELESFKTEMKQMNRLESKRTETLKDFLDNERASRNKLVEAVKHLTQQNDQLIYKPLILSIIELRDFVEAFAHSISFFSDAKKSVLSFMNPKNGVPKKHITDNVNGILKKIDYLLEKESVFPINTESVTFDASLMIATETISDHSVVDNLVIETILKGYVRKEEIIRYAKVKVNTFN